MYETSQIYEKYYYENMEYQNIHVLLIMSQEVRSWNENHENKQIIFMLLQLINTEINEAESGSFWNDHYFERALLSFIFYHRLCCRKVYRDWNIEFLSFH